MGRPKQDISVRLKRHYYDVLNPERFFGEKWPEIRKEARGIVEVENHIYPILKYTLIAVYVGTYANAIKSFKKYNKNGKICYLDATAGAGIYIGKDQKGKEWPVFGTGVIGLIMPAYGLKKLGTVKKKAPQHFDAAIFYEIDNKKRLFLQRLHKRIEDNVHIPSERKYYSDINTIDLDELGKFGCAHWLVVIDPFGAEIKWSTMQKILSLNADIIFNYMCAALRRQLPHQCKDGGAFDDFFGNSNWRSLCNYSEGVGEKLFELYKNNIEGRGYTVYHASVFGSSFDWHYHLMLILRKKYRGDHPWTRPFKEYRKYIEELDEEALYNLFTGPGLTKFM